MSGTLGLAKGLQAGLSIGRSFKQDEKADTRYNNQIERQNKQDERQNKQYERQTQEYEYKKSLRDSQSKYNATLAGYLLNTDNGTKELTPDKATRLYKDGGISDGLGSFIDHDGTGRTFESFQYVDSADPSKGMVAILKEGDGTMSVMSQNRSSNPNDPYMVMKSKDLIAPALSHFAEQGIDVTGAVKLLSGDHGDITKIITDDKTGQVYGITKKGKKVAISGVHGATTKGKADAKAKAGLGKKLTYRTAKIINSAGMEESVTQQFDKNGKLISVIDGSGRNIMGLVDSNRDSALKEDAKRYAQRMVDERNPVGPDFLRSQETMDKSRTLDGRVYATDAEFADAIQRKYMATHGAGLSSTQQKQNDYIDKAQSSPPMEGAKQAPDGNWYIQKDGQWYKVNQ